jgi:exopolysaccharide production protein ExoZ
VTNPRQKLCSLQILRGLAAVWVVVFHLEFLAEHYFNHLEKFRFVHAGQLGVHLFFVLSGFIIFWIHDLDAGIDGAIRAYFLKRITRIYPLLIVLNLVKLAYMAASGYGVRQNKFNFTSVLGSFLLIPTTSNFLIDVTWSLAYEMWFYVGFGILLLLGRNALYRFGVGYGLLTLALNLPGVPALEGMAGFVFDPRIMEFILGCVIAFNLRRLGNEAKSRGFILLIAAVIAIVTGLLNGWDESLSPLLTSTYWGITFGALLFGCLLLERSYDLSKVRIAILLGDSSYSIYLAHSLTLNMLAVVFQKFLPGASGYLLTGILLVCGVMGIALGIACYLLLEHPMQRFFRSRITPGPDKRTPAFAVERSDSGIGPPMSGPDLKSGHQL